MFLYQTLLFIDSIEKKLLSKTIYGKYFIRHRFLSPQSIKPITLIDNNSNFYNIDLNLKYFRKDYKKKKKVSLKIGFSLCLETFVYKSLNFSFNFYLLNSRIYSTNYLKLLFKKLRSFRSKKKILFLLGPKKGGVTCYFNGFCGFFPRKHVLYLQKKKLHFSNIFNLNQNFKTNFCFLRHFKILKQFFFFFRYFKNHQNKYLIKVKNAKKKKICVSFYKYLKLFLFLKPKISNKILLNLIYLCYNKLNINKNFSNLSFFYLKTLVQNKRSILPKRYISFIYYNLSLKLKKRYYNAKIKRKTRKWRKYLFKSRIRIVFLAYKKKKKISKVK